MIRFQGSTLLLAVAVAFFVATPAQSETLRHTLTLPSQSVQLSTIGGTTTVHVEGYNELMDPGVPVLPYRVISFLLPPGEKVAEFSASSSPAVAIAMPGTMLSGAPLLSEDGEAGVGEPLAGVAANGVFPLQPVRHLGTGYWHGRAIASFAIFPLQSHPGQLLLSETVEIELRTEPDDRYDEVVRRERARPSFEASFDQTLRSHVVNPEMNARYRGGVDSAGKAVRHRGFAPTPYPSLEGSPVDYLIITTDALAGEYQRLADWKTAKGVPTVIRTVEWILANTKQGVDVQETLRFFIQDAYAKWGITYLLLGGDTDVLPARYGYSRWHKGGTKATADIYFACLDGSWNDTHDQYWGEGVNGVPFDNPDLYAEVYNGRIPASDIAGVSTVIDKILSYEKAVTPDYLNRFLFLAEVLFPTDWPNDPTITLNGADVAQVLLALGMSGVTMDIDRMYETDWLYPGSSHESKAGALDSLNTGYNFVNHIGHGFRFNMSVGDASILNGDADALTNDGRWFNLFMLNCTAAAYDFFCLGEHYLLNAGGGAVSVIGASDSAYPSASQLYMDEYFKLIFQQDRVHIGEALALSRVPRTPLAEGADAVDLWTHFIYTILADPEMPFFTGTVDTVDLIHVPSVGLGAPSILVNVSCLGSPFDSATVCLSKGEDDYVVGTTDVLGNVILDFTTESPGSISVVCTGLNKVPRQTWIAVTPSGAAYVNFSSSGLVIDDDNTGGTVGNGDGVIDAGETIDFTIELVNTGGAISSGAVNLTLRSIDAQAVVLDSTAAFAAIGSGATAVASDRVRVQYDPGIVDRKAIRFTLKIQDTGAGLWNDTFAKDVHAPRLELIHLRIDDATFGNGNGIVGEAEPLLVFYEIKNYGTGAVNGLTAALEDVSGAFTFFDSTETYPDLLPLTAAENASGFFISETGVTLPNSLRVAVTDSYSRVFVDTFELRAPNPPTALMFDASLGPDRIEVNWVNSNSPDVLHYNVYRAGTSGGPYTLANVDPLDHTVFLDIGLAPSSQYYFVTTAVDESGNESVISAEIETSTNPGQLLGFPISVNTQTTSSPAVGDIDGDGDLEIVVGSDFVYAWHHDGIELIDGDGDAQSWGVLNTVGDLFTAATALANLDGLPGLEIIAADLITKKVYVFDHTGASIAGWPQAAEDEFRAAPAVGDLDGDGDLEVIAVDVAGVVYAWHHNGTEYRDGDSNPGTTGVFYRTPVTTFHYMSPTICDIDNDMQDEIIVGTRGSKIYALNEDGTAVPGWPYTAAGEIVGGVVSGDIDNDGMPEIVAHARSSQVYVINHDGTDLAGFPRFAAINAPFFASSPALGDFNNDDVIDIVIVGFSGLGTKLYLIDGNGANFPGFPFLVTGDATESTPVVADINGDGSLDIVLGDESKFIYAWDVNANMIPGFPIGTNDAVRATPYLGDFDADGDIDMVVYSWDQTVYVYDLDGAYVKENTPWPGLQGNVFRNGRHGFDVPTAIGNVAFSFSVRQNAVDLMWLMAPAGVGGFRLERAEVSEKSPREFVVIATGLQLDDQGFVRFNDRGVTMGQRYVYRLASVDVPGDAYLTQEIYVPISRAELAQNHPNPFNPTTRIEYWVPEGGQRHVQLYVYDVRGARVRTLVNETKRGGRFEVSWDGLNDNGNRVASGVYFYRLAQPGYTATKKMVLLK